MNIIKRIWLPVAIFLLILYLCCMLPGNQIPNVNLNFFVPTDKIVHFIMFFSLSISIYYFICVKKNLSTLTLIILLVIIPILYGILIEVIQANFSDGRSGEIEDVYADGLGSITAFCIIIGYITYRSLTKTV